MARAQHSPRGNTGGKSLLVGAGTLTGDSTGNVVLSAGLKLSNAALLLRANSTALIWGTPKAAKPTTANGAAVTVVSNSTGVALAINVGTTTWKYLATTSVQPT